MTDLLERLGEAEATFQLGYNSGYQEGFKEGVAAAIEHVRKSLSEPIPNPINYEMDVWPDRRILPGYPNFGTNPDENPPDPLRARPDPGAQTIPAPTRLEAGATPPKARPHLPRRAPKP